MKLAVRRHTEVAIFYGTDSLLAATSARMRAAGFKWQCWELDADLLGEALLESAYPQAERIAAVEPDEAQTLHITWFLMWGA